MTRPSKRSLPPLTKGETWPEFWQRYLGPDTLNKRQRQKRTQVRR